MMKTLFSTLFTVILLYAGLFSSEVKADDAQPGYLELKETTSNRYTVTWKVPYVRGRALELSLKFPEEVSNLTEPVVRELSNARVERRIIQAGANGLIDKRIDILGLERTNTEVLMRVLFANGAVSTILFKPYQPWMIIKGPRTAGEVVWDYTLLGFEHILIGFDHLLFVLALLLIVKGIKPLLLTITAFTVAHSITLAIATFGWIWVPAPPLEATIALSILFLASELLKVNNGEYSLTARYPWLVSFSFGLLHGLGFAGALSEVGLPEHEIPLALLMFNVGVELGQICFVLVMLAMISILKKVYINWPKWTQKVPAYAIGSMAAFWFIQRVNGF